LDKIADERIDALNINSNDISNNVDNVIMPLENENHYQHQDDNDFHNDISIEKNSIIDSENSIINNNINTNANFDEQFRNAVATWTMSYNIPHIACNALLKILNKHTSSNFPKDARTLLHQDKLKFKRYVEENTFI